jgi:hypothetical protein
MLWKLHHQILMLIALRTGTYQAKGIHSIFNKIIEKHFLYLKKEMPIQVQESSRTPNRQGQNRISPWHIIFVKTTSTENKEED